MVCEKKSVKQKKKLDRRFIYTFIQYTEKLVHRDHKMKVSVIQIDNNKRAGCLNRSL